MKEPKSQRSRVTDVKFTALKPVAEDEETSLEDFRNAVRSHSEDIMNNDVPVKLHVAVRTSQNIFYILSTLEDISDSLDQATVITRYIIDDMIKHEDEITHYFQWIEGHTLNSKEHPEIHKHLEEHKEWFPGSKQILDKELIILEETSEHVIVREYKYNKKTRSLKEPVITDISETDSQELMENSILNTLIGHILYKPELRKDLGKAGSVLTLQSWYNNGGPDKEPSDD